MAGPNISFDKIPGSIRKPGKYFEFNTSLAVRTLPANKQAVLIVAGRTSGGSVAENVPVSVFSDVQAAQYFGYGSQAHIMASAMLNASPYVSLTMVGVDDNAAGVAAAGTVVVDAAAPASGTLRLYVGNAYVEVAVAKGDAAADIAADLKDAVDNKPILPVTASVATATLTLTAKNDGTCGNDINLTYTAANDCCALTITDMASGSGDPGITTALSTVFAE